MSALPIKRAFLPCFKGMDFLNIALKLTSKRMCIQPTGTQDLSAKLSRRASTYAFLLYAHEGLRHLSKGPKKIWGDRLVDKRTTDSVGWCFQSEVP